ncbi:MAG: hypothetical protein EHM55_25335, partial [Acidobacteria bacterium]
MFHHREHRAHRGVFSFRKRIVLCVLCALCGDPSAWAQDHDEAWKRCRGTDADARLSACTALIDAGQEAAELASAYYARGIAYRQKSLFARALEDLNAAIKANPELIDAYGDRGITLTILGRYADAIPDYSRVIDA